MTVANIITDALKSVPPRVRLAMLLIFAAAVVGTQIAEAFEVDIHAGVYRSLLIVGGYLGVQSAANVSREH
jgi:hypothetical protein